MRIVLLQQEEKWRGKRKEKKKVTRKIYVRGLLEITLELYSRYESERVRDVSTIRKMRRRQTKYPFCAGGENKSPQS